MARFGGTEVVTELVHDGNPGGQVELGDVGVGNAIEHLDHGAQAVAVGGHQQGAAPAQLGHGVVLEPRPGAPHHVGQAFRCGDDGRVQPGVAGVVAGVEGVVGTDGWRWHVVGPSPHLHLGVAVSGGGLGLVEASEIPVVTLVEAPGAMYRYPQPAHGLECQVGRTDGPRLQRRVQHVGQDPGLGQQHAGGAGLALSGGGEIGIPPSREAVLEVPLALAVAEKYEVSRHARTIHRRPWTHRRKYLVFKVGNETLNLYDYEYASTEHPLEYWRQQGCFPSHHRISRHCRGFCRHGSTCCPPGTCIAST